MWLVAPAAGIVLASFAILFTAFVYFDRADKLEDAQRGACARVNELRARVNRNSLILHRVLETAAQEPNQPRYIQRAYRRAAALPMYGGYTDCDKAVQDPLGYMPPKPTPIRAHGHR